MGFEVFDFIDRKKAGMYALCDNWASVLEGEAKTNADWKDSEENKTWKARTNHARQAMHGGVNVRGNNYSIFISHGVEYGGILEEGSKPHTITPKNKPYLCFRGSDGDWRKTKVVHHPGTKGFKTLENTLERNKGMIVETIIQHWSD
ncbi:hypothetical protein [Clostridium senegalense]|uniref:hypothetical protein n=1 Tax=Clostridium senegalense TaxID=1465809 RepID=UPI0002897E14|nr:hypothetical protein [Clostridium senegalense]